jgi:hypothetical protein
MGIDEEEYTYNNLILAGASWPLVSTRLQDRMPLRVPTKASSLLRASCTKLHETRDIIFWRYYSGSHTCIPDPSWRPRRAQTMHVLRLPDVARDWDEGILSEWSCHGQQFGPAELGSRAIPRGRPGDPETPERPRDVVNGGKLWRGTIRAGRGSRRTHRRTTPWSFLRITGHG